MFSIPQVAKILNLSRARVWRLVRAGRIKALTIEGGKLNEYRISQESLSEFQETRSQSPGRKPKQKPETVSEVVSPKMQPSEPTES